MYQRRTVSKRKYGKFDGEEASDAVVDEGASTF